MFLFLYKIVPEDNQEDTNEAQEQTDFEVTTDQAGVIDNLMIVKEQPKPDQRARYASDGSRFLPDSKKHPMSIQVCF